MTDWIRIILIGMAIALMPARVSLAEEVRGLVLAADARSDMQPLTVQEVRKAYLGGLVTRGEHVVEPLLNLVDESLYEIFLQKVMFMSAQAYQRQLTRRFLHAQGRRPAAYRNRSELFAALSAKPHAVTYVMWMDEVERHTNLKVIAVLWDGKS